VSMTVRFVVVAGAVAILAGCGGGRHTRTPRTVSRAPAQPGTSTQPSPAISAGRPPATMLNAPSCTPPPRHPYPVVVLPGTFGVSGSQLIGTKLAQLGYCVYTFSYGNNETGDIAASAHQLAGFVNRLLARSGARRVSIVGHSEGGMMPRYYIKFLGGAARVASLVALAPSNHGTLNPTTFGGALIGCVACVEQQTGSPFLTKLNAGDEDPSPVKYTVIETMYDAVVIPYTSAFLSGPTTRVTNVTLQQQCPRDVVGHLGITADPVALQWVENALAHNGGPADPNFSPSC
jgi:triacylglycerol lipase